MPIVNGTYVQLTESDIRDALETELQTEFGEDIDLTESSVFSTLTTTLATVLSENQEQSLDEVYQSAFLDTATGEDLEKVVAIIGLQRRSAVHSTGVQRFISDTPVTQDFTIQSGTVVQTDSDNPVQFETSETAILQYIDGFEDQNFDDYSGDTGTGTFTFNTSDPYDGSAALEAGATLNDHVFNDEVTIQEGTELRYRVSASSGTVPIVTFGVQDNSNYYQLVIDNSLDEMRLEKVEGGSISQTIDTNTGLSIPDNKYLDVELDWRIDGQMLVEVRDDNEGALTEENATVVGTLGGADSNPLDRWHGGFVGAKSGDSSGTKLFDEFSTAAVSANIRAQVGGDDGNLGASTLTVLPSVPSGVDDTNNLFPTGNNTFEDRDQIPFVVGRNEESDEELRDRAQQSVSGGGDATHDAIVNALLNDVEGVSSVTVFENKTAQDNTGSGGLPPHSFEAVVFGGGDQEVGETIFDKKAITARSYGGANGSLTTITVTAESNSQQFDIDFSRPTKVDVDFTMDLVVDDTYVGDDDLRDLITEYVGGTQSDGTSAIGLGVGDDVRIDFVEDIVVGDDTGVIGFDKNASTEDITTTPSKTTDTNGLDIVEIGSNEVAQTDATDNSITINTTEI